MKQDIIDNVKKVARRLGLNPGEEFTYQKYFENGGRHTEYQVADGGYSWKKYCEAAGFKPKIKEQVSPEECWERYKRAIAAIKEIEGRGRHPKNSELKKYKLLFGGDRYRTLNECRQRAVEEGLVPARSHEVISGGGNGRPLSERVSEEKQTREMPNGLRPVPPIPLKTKRRKWQQTGIEGFPYAPQEESGVAAILAVLCANRKLPWQILDLSAKGIDATVYDEQEQRELRVELKHTLSKSGWNHSIDSLDCVVCWENRWKDFPKPVYELRSLVKR
jgi:hypothetical protein